MSRRLVNVLNGESLHFPLSDANSILFNGLPGVRFIEEYLPQRYDRPHYINKSRQLSKEQYQSEIIQTIEKIKIELRQSKVALETIDWPDLIKSLPNEIQYIAYTYFYWTKTSNPSLVNYLKRQGAYSEPPHFTKEHDCEACGKQFKLKFNKSGRGSKDNCPLCGHSSTEKCLCKLCTGPDKIALSNIGQLSAFIDNWIQCNNNEIELQIGNEIAKIKNSILSLWDIKFSTENFTCNSTLSRFFFDYNSSQLNRDKTIIFNINARFSNTAMKSICWDIKKPLVEYTSVNIPTVKAKAIKYSVKEASSDGSKVFVLSGSSNSNGYKDFISICESKIKFQSHFFDSRAGHGLYACIASLGAKFNDTIVIVRGGGDTAHESFNAFKSTKAADAIQAMVCLGVFVIVGVGHSNDSFIIERNASIAAITPTDAAYKLLHHMKVFA